VLWVREISGAEAMGQFGAEPPQRLKPLENYSHYGMAEAMPLR
jgi:hypothetical protein